MPKFPEPPGVEVLRGIGPRVRLLPAGTELWRVYFRGGRHPGAWDGFRRYGPVSTARFDHHLPPAREQDRAILYAAVNGLTCVAEVFQRTRTIDRRRNLPWLVGFGLAAEVVLLDLTGAWPTAAGVSMAINSGPRPRARRWSRAIYAAYPEVGGLWYASSMHANRPAVALYERSIDGLQDRPFFHRSLDDPMMIVPLRNAVRELGYGLA